MDRLTITPTTKIVILPQPHPVQPVHHCLARSAENIAIVSEIVAEDPNVSIPRHS